jgi:CPA1 family monovalent cation:H+ antiporter
MNEALVLTTFLVAVVILSIVAKRLRIPYPIAFVIGGVALAFMHNLPHPRFDPELILLLVLPPLLFSAAWTTDWVAMRRNWQPITFMAVGLVIFTTVAVAVFVHALVPDFGWPLAFTLGAIVSPPDAVASEAIFEHIAVPRRVASIINGECLLNDATALVLYRFALAALVSGAFSLARASIAFFVVASGGLAVGILAAFACESVLRYLGKRGFDDPLIASVVLLLAPFAAYVPAEELHCSGVLAAVAAGIVLSRRSMHFIDAETRLVASSVWRLLTFILNTFAFLLIGLQLPVIVGELMPHVRDYFLYGLGLSAVVIVVRIVWVFPAAYLPHLLSKRMRIIEASPSWRGVSVLAWAGMRGIVSLAAALALPYSLGDQPFPQRSIAIFFTFCVVFVTLVFQGLTLQPLIERLGVAETSKSHRRENLLRIRALEAGEAAVREHQETHHAALDAEISGRVLEEYQQRINVLKGKASPDGAAVDENRLDRHVQKEALDAERRAIMAMRQAGEIPDDIFRVIEYDLDLAALRLT